MGSDTQLSINLMQLKFFLVVAEFQNISKAAEHLFRTQSAITRAISDLEKQLQIELFERHHNGVILTDIGSSLLIQVKNAIEELRQIPLIVQKYKNLDSEQSQPINEPFFLYNTRRLEIFSTLYLTKGMKNTASLLNITQPAVSSAIKLLEESLNIELFIRTPNGIRATEVCELLQQNIKRCLNIINDLPNQIANFIGNMQGTVRIGALPLIRTFLLPKAIAALANQYPRIRFLTFESAYESLVAQLRSGDIDFIVGAIRPQEQSSDLYSQILFDENMFMVVRNKHPLLRKKIQLPDLLDQQWILPRTNSPARILLENNFKSLNLIPPEPTVETGDLALSRGLLLESNMIAVVSEQQMKYELDQGLIKKLPFDLPQTTRQIGLIFRKNSIQSSVTKALIQSLENICKEIV
ncbi:LysR family transcriptional regulator [Acinetobacter baumannii]|uniref:LysR family transcriptional regulator n=5 Tax=Acinetobacter baumannii TaxID=470 RepID=A0A3R9RF50_ACIBA|nr:LysR family transcriptional regulator [Acinetobacter baumannii]MBK5977971.1 LysR family transcriptional regulator [Acinetobacter baumannii]MBU3150278.1 LysR family transcriptional regulator [Acinetobacter baumannii]MCT9379544.1 LysR family transcriptional regulator [Acinetobacter baumannii]MDC5242529.1 LysR family transcriptional regulator [Acinetobacter baumannii]QJF29661.1 LysR family transcriptional regulator [Acinetobacter baumannii]